MWFSPPTFPLEPSHIQELFDKLGTANISNNFMIVITTFIPFTCRIPCSFSPLSKPNRDDIHYFKYSQKLACSHLHRLDSWLGLGNKTFTRPKPLSTPVGILFKPALRAASMHGAPTHVSFPVYLSSRWITHAVVVMVALKKGLQHPLTSGKRQTKHHAAAAFFFCRHLCEDG